MAFSGKVAWITGASAGIGEAVAYALHQEGARLIISARREEKLQALKERCGNPDSIVILPLDLEEMDSLQDKARQAIVAFGQIDYMFHNGGISQRSLAAETDPEVVERVMTINFLGGVAINKVIIPHMLERGDGHFVITSSVTGKLGTRLRSAYAASKHALHGYYDSLRQEVHDEGIDVTLVCPGFIKTDVTVNALTGDGSKHNKMGEGQAHGMEPADFAQRLLRVVRNKKQEVYIGGFRERLGLFIRTLFPKLFYSIIRKIDVT
jgi:dehydrogenase/reductase SDR family protein 7B